VNPGPKTPSDTPPGGQQPPTAEQPSSLPSYPSQASLPVVKGRSLRTLGIVIASVVGAAGLIAVGFIFYAIYSVSGAGHSNQAQADIQPVLAQMQRLGGKAICDNGDNGYGVDNTEPWYEAYYSMPSSKSLTSKIKNAASSQGYTLTVDSDTIDQLKTGDNVSERYNPASDYLAGSKGKTLLSVVINRNTSVALNCNTGTYGRSQNTASGAIIDLILTLPSTR
jgi:hypothetical protein